MEALKKGIANLDKHIENIKKYGVPVVVTLNAFITDTQEEYEFIKKHCEEQGCEFALAKVWEKGGEVVVGITVNPSGEVVAAKVASGGDDCMREAALEAARNSLFNIDDSAPARQSGTITYLFIPQ